MILFQVNSSIAVRFTDMHIEAHGECMWDFVEIREGRLNEGPQAYYSS